MTSTEQPGELSEEELRAYLDQLREAPAADILVQAYTMIGTGAEVKLGRPDARLLIDAMAGLVSAVGARLGELGTRMQGGVAQLQSAQVEAERQVAQQAQAQQPAAPEAPAQPPAAPGGQGGSGGQGNQNLTDRLWIPGRGQGPGRR
jgi:hypothetical protein